MDRMTAEECVELLTRLGYSAKINDEGLRKCPFCGGEARLIRNARRKIYGKDEYRVGVVACCNVCEARMFYGSEKLAIEAWNRRVKDEKGRSNQYPCHIGQTERGEGQGEI